VSFPLFPPTTRSNDFRGVLAGVIGAASFVQPELVAGEVAVIGTMAKTAAQKGAISIAQTEGKKLVQAVAQDVKQSDTDVKADLKDAKSDEKDANAKGTDEKTTAPAVEPTPNTNGDKTISIEVAQPQDTTKSAGETPGKKDDVEPVSLKITIGADGKVKDVTKAVKEESKVSETSPAATPDALPSKTEVPAEEIPVVAVTPATQPESTSAPKESSEIEPSKVETKDLVSEPVEDVKTTAPLLKEEATKAASEPLTKQVEAQNLTLKENGVQGTPAAVSLPEPATAQQVTSSSVEAPIIATSTIATAATISSTTTDAPKPTVQAPPVPTVTISQESLDALHHSMPPSLVSHPREFS
jgi:hypothetical protein